MRNIAEKLFALLTASCMLVCTACSDKKDGSSAASDTVETASGAELEFVIDPEAPELGEYTVSATGIKHYYSPDEVSPELMAALEQYFVAYSQSDYEAYTKSVYPDYITEMNKYLERDYGYGHQQSFENQCETLKTNAGGEFKVTRIKAELPEKEAVEDYFTDLNNVFEFDFYNAVAQDVDKFYDIIFYVMVEAEGKETLLISEFEIVFAEKDGVLYTFG